MWTGRRGGVRKVPAQCNDVGKGRGGSMGSLHRRALECRPMTYSPACVTCYVTKLIKAETDRFIDSCLIDPSPCLPGTPHLHRTPTPQGPSSLPPEEASPRQHPHPSDSPLSRPQLPGRFLLSRLHPLSPWDHPPPQAPCSPRPLCLLYKRGLGSRCRPPWSLGCGGPGSRLH